MNKYVISQIFVIIATIFIGSTYFVKSKDKIMILCVIYCLFYGIHYFLLGAYTGFVMTLISTFRNIWFYNTSKKNKKNNSDVLLVFISVSIMSGIYTYSDDFSLISILASIMSTYSIWQDNIKFYRLLAIPVSICFIIYSVHINSIFSIVTESVLLFMEIIGIIELKLNKDKIINYIEENEI